MKFRNIRIDTHKRAVRTSALAALTAAFVLCASACGGGGKDKASPSPSPSQVPTPTPPAAAAEMVKIVTVSSIDGPLNIRSEANTDSEVLGQAFTGNKFELLTGNYTSEWHEISYQGKKAYVYAEFVTVSEVDKSTLNTASADPSASADPNASASPEATATPDPNAPITVNGSGREDVSSSTSSSGVTAEGLSDTEDPERR